MINLKKFNSLNLLSFLIIFNLIAFFIFGILILINNNLIDYIALNPKNLFFNQYFWTLFTSMFMHAGFFHLLANMLSLFFIGGILIKIIGEKRFIFLYLISGIFAGLFFSLLSLLIKSEFNSYSVGASGAIFGLVGTLMILTPNLPVYIMFIPIPIKMKFAAPLILFSLWVISLLGNIPIGNIAHLGGFMVGLIYGLYLKNKFKRKIVFVRNYFS
jgi:membrane associated rhomboid family serine protease